MKKRNGWSATNCLGIVRHNSWMVIPVEIKWYTIKTKDNFFSKTYHLDKKILILQCFSLFQHNIWSILLSKNMQDHLHFQCMKHKHVWETQQPWCESSFSWAMNFFLHTWQANKTNHTKSFMQHTHTQKKKSHFFLVFWAQKSLWVAGENKDISSIGDFINYTVLYMQ